MFSTERYKIVLASNSPRRRELLAGLEIPFEVRVIKGIDESYPSDLMGEDIPKYISMKKAEAYRPALADDELLVTADTIVYLDGVVFGKPKDRQDAIDMLGRLSGKTHEVITGVTLATNERNGITYPFLDAVRTSFVKRLILVDIMYDVFRRQ